MTDCTNYRTTEYDSNDYGDDGDDDNVAQLFSFSQCISSNRTL